MLKKAVTYFLFALCIIAFGAYLWFSGQLRANAVEKEICTGLSIEILDSASYRLVTPSTITEMICRIENPVGHQISEIDIHRLENGITAVGAVLNTEVAIDRNGTVHVQVTQRHPILRFQSTEYGYYMDDTGFCFPLSDLFTSDVPVVSGSIRENDLKWKNGMLELGQYLDGNRFWNTQIEQINVSDDGTLTFFSRTSEHRILFGHPENIESKLSRLMTFYKNIAPIYGWDYYSSVNLNFQGQIVCTRAENKNN